MSPLGHVCSGGHWAVVPLRSLTKWENHLRCGRCCSAVLLASWMRWTWLLLLLSISEVLLIGLWNLNSPWAASERKRSAKNIQPPKPTMAKTKGSGVWMALGSLATSFSPDRLEQQRDICSSSQSSASDISSLCRMPFMRGGRSLILFLLGPVCQFSVSWREVEIPLYQMFNNPFDIRDTAITV